MSKLAGPNFDEVRQGTLRGVFQELASRSAKEQWNVDGSVQEKWEADEYALP